MAISKAAAAKIKSNPYVRNYLIRCAESTGKIA